jgi:hypothetical protein
MYHGSDAEALLSSYPRARPPLSSEHARIYVEEYRRNRRGDSPLAAMVQRLEGWMHDAIKSPASTGSILEIGAGTLNHVPFENGRAPYDIVEPFEELWRDSPHRHKVGQFYRDIAEVPLTLSYDRILSVAVLEHLTDLPRMVAESVRRLDDKGRFAAAFPSEGGLLWGLAWRLTTGVSYRLRNRLPYSVVMKHEHVNSADDILRVLTYFFGTVRVRRFPLRWRHLSFYTVAIAANPLKARAETWLSNRPAA